MITKKLQEFFEKEGFQVHLSKEGRTQCAEVEKWTDGGVDMVIFLRPFNTEKFKEWVKDFDVDDEIDTHRQDKRYKNDFTITQSVKDFTDFHNHLKEVALKL